MDPPTCNCSSLALNNSIFEKELSNHPSFLIYNRMVMVKPIIQTDGCSTTVYCEGDYDLVIFDLETDTVFGKYSADGLCDARTQTWQVDVDAGFQAFKRLYGMCAYLKDNNDECTPHNSTHTFFLAYSNDLNIYTAFYLAERLECCLSERSSYYTHFATVRFDQTSPGPIQYTTNWTAAHSYILDNLPKPSLSFPKNETGSDVLESVILNFLRNEEVPLCGASILILTRRYPGPTSIEHSELVNRLREFNIHLHIFFSTFEAPYGIPNQFDLYDLAAKTNGLFAYNIHQEFQTMLMVGIPLLTTPYQIYAVNREVSGSGKISLPPMSAPFDSFQYRSELVFTFGDQFNSTDSSYAVVTWTGANEAGTADSRTCEQNRKGDNFCSKQADLSENTYTMELEYNVSKPTTLMVRAYSRLQTTQWIPFDL
ncbi:unnamed protein product [Caenorhabditis brenneri]